MLPLVVDQGPRYRQSSASAAAHRRWWVTAPLSSPSTVHGTRCSETRWLRVEAPPAGQRPTSRYRSNTSAHSHRHCGTRQRQTRWRLGCDDAFELDWHLPRHYCYPFKVWYSLMRVRTPPVHHLRTEPPPPVCFVHWWCLPTYPHPRLGWRVWRWSSRPCSWPQYGRYDW